MKKQFIVLLFLFTIVKLYSQPAGYYNGTDGKNGDELKAVLNDIISGHTQYSYFFSKEIFKLSDADPANPSNVLLIYSGFSHANNDYGNGSNQLNREHVWAKSHGSFTDMPPMYNDVHNLKPEDASVNQDKSNLDFDNGGQQHPEATGCYFTDSTWEARDEVKGDVARIIFYMATRYEGENEEIDLEIVDHNHSYPNAQHGRLSTLLQWNLQDPPDDFERNRNNVIYSFQKNRNPFIDNPQFAQLIWGGQTANPLTIDNVQTEPELAVAGEPVRISANIGGLDSREAQVVMNWGLSYDQLDKEVEMNSDGNEYYGLITCEQEGATVYFRITVTNGSLQHSTVIYNYYVPKKFNGTLVSIYQIQGQQEVSPYKNQVVSTSGIVTANFGSSYFIQDGTGEWNGLFIYESGRNPQIGDSVVITGLIDEYYEKTEMKNISDYYLISRNNELPEPISVQTGEIEEGLESVLVKISNAECVDANYQADYFMWKVDDGSGILKIHNTSIFEFVPTEGVGYDITGPVNYDFDEWKIELRFQSDVKEGGDIQKPFVLTATPVIATNIKVDFSEPVESLSAEQAENYSMNNGVIVESAVQHPFNKSQVNLTVSAMDGNYELTISSVKDLAGNVMDAQILPISFVGIEDKLANKDISVYPNPAKDKLFVEFNTPQSEIINLSIVDMTGKEQSSRYLLSGDGSNKISLQTTDFRKGMYILELTIGETIIRTKFIKD